MQGWELLPERLADLIRENAGVKVTFFIFIGLLFADMATQPLICRCGRQYGVFVFPNISLSRLLRLWSGFWL